MVMKASVWRWDCPGTIEEKSGERPHSKAGWEETERKRDLKEQLEKQKEIGENKVTDPKGTHGFKETVAQCQELLSVQ